MNLRGIGMPYNASQKFIDQKANDGLKEKVAIYYGDEQITYRELSERVNQTGNMLKELGVRMETRVLMVCHDSPEFVYSFFGAIKIGAVPVPVNTMMKPSDYEYFLNHSRAETLIIHQDLWEEICHLRKRFIYLKHVIVIADGDKPPVTGEINFHEQMEQADKRLTPVHTQYDDPAFWLYSSGSTGDPKGVIHLQHDMSFSFDRYARQILHISKDDICFSASKLFFAYGLGGGMYFPLGAGASTVLFPGKLTPEAVLKVIEKYRPTIYFGIPTLYGSIIRYVQKSQKQYDLSSLRICVSAGEALPESFLCQWRRLFQVDILDGIGSTEALHIYLSNRMGDIRNGSCGKVVPGYDAKIVGEDGKTLPPNQIGDLYIRGDSVAHGYWNLHKQNKQKFLGEWFHTGDKYYMDDEGYFWYCGRSDDMLKVGGIWVSPIEIENCLLQHEAVFEAAVVGEADPDDLILPKAYVVLKDEYEPSEELANKLQEFVKQHLAHYKYPRAVEFIDALPKTATGKIRRFKLKTSMTGGER